MLHSIPTVVDLLDNKSTEDKLRIELRLYSYQEYALTVTTTSPKRRPVRDSNPCSLP